MHEQLSKGTVVFQIEFSGKMFFTQNWCNITLMVLYTITIICVYSLLTCVLAISKDFQYLSCSGAVMPSVAITTKVVSSNPVHGEVY